MNSRLNLKRYLSSGTLRHLGAMALASMLVLGVTSSASAACFGGVRNGVVDPGETCDDNNNNTNDGCTNNCAIAVCGDGIQWNTGGGTEECDQGTALCSTGHATTLGQPCANDSGCLGICAGGTNPGGACSSNAQCSGGGVCGGHSCSGPAQNQNIPDTCRTNCKLPACGDSIADPLAGEGCDPGASNSNTCDGPSAGAQKCTSAACGDNYVNSAAGETCDATGGVDSSSCDGSGAGANSCTAATCGDNYVNAAALETCDATSGVDSAVCDGAGAGANKCTVRNCGDLYANLAPGSGEQCDSGTVDSATCNKSTAGIGIACQLAACSDGYMNTAAGETCDDNNNANNDVCPDGIGGTCHIATCGDGFTCNSGCTSGPSGGNEACDDDNASNNDACLNICANAVCGDGFVYTGTEACDDGNANPADACRNDCAPADCGDAIVQPGESCDLGTSTCAGGFNSGDDCSADVQCPGTCAGGSNNGFPCATGAQCPGGACGGVSTCTGPGNRDDSANQCRSNCLPARCGDGYSGDTGESCDDGNAINTDACVISNPGGPATGADDATKNCALNDCTDSFACTAGSCAGVPDGIQPCDDDNAINTDACVGTCDVAVCGDGYTQTGVEDCDDGVNDGGVNQCNPGCVASFCGDGDADTGESCDDGNVNNNDACTNACAIAICGDGIVRTGVEDCDDFAETHCNSGTVPIGTPCTTDAQCGPGAPGRCSGAGDGCSAACDAIGCGDGIVQSNEQCDGGNTAPGDGCDAGCRLEVCGNAVVGYDQFAALEQCDDGNLAAGDGCNGVCDTEFCGDTVVQAGLGETCDAGPGNSNSVPNACRTNCQPYFCGDSVVDPANTEACDGGANNTATCDGPSAGAEKCTAAACGDGFVNAAAGEDCEAPFSNVLPNACRTGCIAPSCGDTVTDNALGEQCDGGLTCTAACCSDGTTGFNAGFSGYTCSRIPVDACSISSCSTSKKINKMLANADKKMTKGQSKAAIGKLDQAARQAANAAKKLAKAKEAVAAGCVSSASCLNSTLDTVIDVCLSVQTNLVVNNP